MIADYFFSLRDMPSYCREYKRWVVKKFFTAIDQHGYEKESDTPVDYCYSYGHFCYHPEYQQRLEVVRRCVDICHVFGITELTIVQPQLRERAHRLGEPELVKTRKSFIENVDFIANTFQSKGFPISGMISNLHATEAERLLEAIHCLFEGCRYSAVAMAASAIEFRLLDFMKRINPDTSTELDRKPLGSLIKDCLENPVYSKKLPEWHHPLLTLCNEFRVFSVHPKTELIGQNEAISVILLAFSFILDERLRKTTE